MIFGVITAIGEPPGNLALPFDLMVETEPLTRENGWKGKVIPIIEAMGQGFLALRAPVFTLGEVVILDEFGRELVGRWRKPEKWDVTCEHFESIEEAVARAIEVMEAAEADPPDPPDPPDPA